MGYILAVVAMVLWGLVQIPIKLARAPGRAGVVVSMTVGLVTIGIILGVQGKLALPQASATTWALIFVNGLLHFPLGTFIYYDAVRLAGVTNASPVTRLTPVLVVAGAAALGMGTFSLGVGLSAILVFLAGVLLAKGAHDTHPPESRRDLRVGMGLAFIACLIWAAGDLLVPPLNKAVGPGLVVFYGLAAGLIFQLVYLAVAGKLRDLRELTGRDYLCYGLHGVFSFALAYWIFFESINLIGVSSSVVITGCWPLVGVLAGLVVFREPMNLAKAVGIALFIGSAAMAAFAGRISPGYFAAISAVILWGAVQIPIKLAKAPGHLGVLVAMPAGLLAVFVILLCQGRLSLPEAGAKDWTLILLTGFVQFPIATAFAFEAIRRAGLTTATPITRLEPVIVVIVSGVLGCVGVSWWTGSAAFTWWLAPAAALVFGGGLLLARGARDAEPPESRKDLYIGMLSALGACAFWATGDLMVSQVSDAIPRPVVLFWALAFGMVVFWIGMALFGKVRELKVLTRRDVVCYVLQGIGSFALGYWGFYESVRLLGVSRSAIITGCWPLPAVIAGVVMFREPMNWMKWAGVALFVVGAALAGLAPG